MINSFYLCMVYTMLSTTSSFHLTKDSVITACESAQTTIVTSHEEDIDPCILSALIYHESRYKPKAKSHVGACGLTQVLPKYVKYTCEQLQTNTALSIEVGASILRGWLSRRANSYFVSLQCYNSGYRCKSKNYANKILKTAKKLKTTYYKTQRTMENALH